MHTTKQLLRTLHHSMLPLAAVSALAGPMQEATAQEKAYASPATTRMSGSPNFLEWDAPDGGWKNVRSYRLRFPDGSCAIRIPGEGVTPFDVGREIEHLVVSGKKSLEVDLEVGEKTSRMGDYFVHSVNDKANYFERFKPCAVIKEYAGLVIDGKNQGRNAEEIFRHKDKTTVKIEKAELDGIISAIEETTENLAKAPCDKRFIVSEDGWYINRESGRIVIVDTDYKEGLFGIPTDVTLDITDLQYKGAGSPYATLSRYVLTGSELLNRNGISLARKGMKKGLEDAWRMVAPDVAACNYDSLERFIDGIPKKFSKPVDGLEFERWLKSRK